MKPSCNEFFPLSSTRAIQDDIVYYPVHLSCYSAVFRDSVLTTEVSPISPPFLKRSIAPKKCVMKTKIDFYNKHLHRPAFVRIHFKSRSPLKLFKTVIKQKEK